MNEKRRGDISCTAKEQIKVNEDQSDQYEIRDTYDIYHARHDDKSGLM